MRENSHREQASRGENPVLLHTTTALFFWNKRISAELPFNVEVHSGRLSCVWSFGQFGLHTRYIPVYIGPSYIIHCNVHVHLSAVQCGVYIIWKNISNPSCQQCLEIVQSHSTIPFSQIEPIDAMLKLFPTFARVMIKE